MLIKALSDFKIENMGKRPFEIAKNDFADLRLDIAQRAILHGVAVAAHIDDVVPYSKVKAKTTSTSQQSNDADKAKE